MSYSTSVRGATKALALAALAAKLAEICSQQPCHKRDLSAIEANAANAVALLPDDADKDVVISVNGYLSWNTPVLTGSDEEQTVPLTTVSICCGASLGDRIAEPPAPTPTPAPDDSDVPPAAE